MVNISLTLYTKGFFGSVLKSPTQMGSLSINNSATNISRLGTFKGRQSPAKSHAFHSLLEYQQSVHVNILWSAQNLAVECSVVDPDPDPPDPHVFGPLGSGSGSTSQRYGSGSFYHHAKIVRKTLIPTIL
jgi:hypothetical protein